MFVLNNDFKSIEYLSKGNNIQKKAYKILKEYDILGVLKDYKPILIGTIPIEINVENSDLDICCYCEDLKVFYQFINKHFSHFNRFEIVEKGIDKEPCIVSTFIIEDFEIEIFGQDKPSEEQNGYKHLLVEAYLLQLHGDEFKKQIIELKKGGLKTEPAFAKALGLKGDPYKKLLNLFY